MSQLLDKGCGMVERRAWDGERIESFLSHPLCQLGSRDVETTLIVAEATRLPGLLPRIVDGTRIESQLAQRKQCVPGQATNGQCACRGPLDRLILGHQIFIGVCTVDSGDRFLSQAGRESSGGGGQHQAGPCFSGSASVARQSAALAAAAPAYNQLSSHSHYMSGLTPPRRQGLRTSAIGSQSAQRAKTHTCRSAAVALDRIPNTHPGAAL